MKIVDATAAHLAQFYEGLPARTCRAWAIVDGERVLGVCGFYREGIGSTVFTEILPELRAHPRIIVAAGKMVMAELAAKRRPIFAACDFTVEASERFLKHFGFIQQPNGVFRCQA